MRNTTDYRGGVGTAIGPDKQTLVSSDHRVVVSGERKVTGQLAHPGEPLTTSAGRLSGTIIWSQSKIISRIIGNLHLDQKSPSNLTQDHPNWSKRMSPSGF